MTTISKFTGDNRFLSNFYVEGNGVGVTVEHRFQAAKTLDPHDQHVILTASGPERAKWLGRRVVLRPDWEEVKVRIMAECVAYKFTNPQLAVMLEATSDALLIEGNTWHDNTWGACYCPHCLDIDGMNWLGVILMTVRATL